MKRYILLPASVVGAFGLVASVLTTAFAGPPPDLHAVVSAKSGPTLRGNVTVTGNLKLKKGLDVTGLSAARGGEQVSNGLSVLSGGIMTDSEKVTGTLQAQSAIVSQNLQATDLQASALTLTGPNQTTTALNLTGSAAVSGGLTAGTGTFNNLNITGGVDFSHARVTGLSLSNVNVNGSLQSLTLGSPSSSAPPLTLSANGHTSLLTVDSNGALSVDQLAATGSISATQNVQVGGDLTAARVLAPDAIGTSTPGPLLLTGSTIQLGGNAMVTGTTTLGGDLLLGSSPSTPSHVVAGGNTDLAGTAQIDVTSGCSATDGCTQTVNFNRPFASAPIVTVTAAGDPAPGSVIPPKVWVATTVSGFVIHYVAPSSASVPYTVVYNYHVVGS